MCRCSCRSNSFSLFKGEAELALPGDARGRTVAAWMDPRTPTDWLSPRCQRRKALSCFGVSEVPRSCGGMLFELAAYRSIFNPATEAKLSRVARDRVQGKARLPSGAGSTEAARASWKRRLFSRTIEALCGARARRTDRVLNARARPLRRRRRPLTSQKFALTLQIRIAGCYMLRSQH